VDGARTPQGEPEAGRSGECPQQLVRDLQRVSQIQAANEHKVTGAYSGEAMSGLPPVPTVAAGLAGRSLAASTGSSIDEVGGTIAATKAAVRHAAAKPAAKHARIHSSLSR